MEHGIHLEPLSTSHLEQVFSLWSDFEAVKFTNWRHTPTPEACAERLSAVLEYYARAPRHVGPFALRAGDGRFVGLAGADVRAESPERFDVWYALLRAEWGRGLGTRALGALLDRMSASGQARVATATACTDNRASWSILEKHGFRREGVVPGGHTRHGLCLDLFQYSRSL